MRNMIDYALTLYQSAKGGTLAHHSNVTDKARYWQRSITAQGGAQSGSFRIVAPQYELQDWFYNRLGWHVEEVAGGRTWAGLIYEMDLTLGGSVWRRSLDDLANSVKARYTHDSDPATDTATVTNTSSIARFGTREEILILDDYPQTASENMRDLWLNQHAFPDARPITVGYGGESYLDVTVLGYWKVLEWRFSSVQAGTDADVSTYIDSILDADATDYLTVGFIRPNTLQVKQSTPNPERVWDVLQEQVALGGKPGSTAVPYRLWVDNQRKVFYDLVDTTPMYALRDDGLYPYAGGSKVGSRQVVPAVVRDMRYPMARAESGSWLSDVRDTWVETVQVDADGNLSLTTSLYDPAEVTLAQLSAQYAKEREAREEAERKRREQEERDRRAWEEASRKREATRPRDSGGRPLPGWVWDGNQWVPDTGQGYMR